MSMEQRVAKVENAPARVLGTEILVRDMFTTDLHAVVVLRRQGRYCAVCEPQTPQAREER